MSDLHHSSTNVRSSEGPRDVPVMSFAGVRLAFVLSYYALNAVFAVNVFSVWLTLPLLIITCLVMARIKAATVQVADMIWFCIFIFLVIGPVQAIGLDGVIGEQGRARFAYTEAEYIVAMAVAIMFVTPLALVRSGSLHFGEVVNNPRRLWMLLSLSILAATLFVIAEGGVARVLSPRLERSAADSFIASQLFLGVQTVATTLLVGEILANQRVRRWWPALVLVLALLLLVRNPFNASRFTLIAAWIPVIFVFLRGRVSITSFYALCMFGLLVAFPILSATTRHGVDGLDTVGSIDFLSFALHIPFVDLFDTLVHAVRYVDQHGPAWGTKTVAVVLFFIPRALWPGKPIVGGLDVGNELYYAGLVGTPNLSFLLGGDFYLDFQFPGVVILSVVTGLVVRALVQARWGFANGIPIARILLLASMPILLRGPVGAILPLFVCQMAAIPILALLAGGRRIGTTARSVPGPQLTF